MPSSSQAMDYISLPPFQRNKVENQLWLFVRPFMIWGYNREAYCPQVFETANGTTM